MAVLQQADLLAVLSRQMVDSLTKLGIETPMILAGLPSLPLNIELPDHEIHDIFNPNRALYTGQLSKANFLEQLDLQHVNVTVYGPNPSDEIKNNAHIDYQGQRDFYELMKELVDFDG